MPTYDYECKSCGKRYELFQSITAKPVKKCTHCGKSSATRLIGTGAGIIFKGSGFYETDYRSESYKNAAKADKEASTGGDKKESKDKSADKKPTAEAKSTSKKSADKKK